MSTNPFSDHPQEASAPPVPMQAGPPSTSQPALPVWAWIFVVAAVGIPVITCGGAVPVIIAVIAIGACASLSRNVQIPLPVRVIGCLLITAAGYAGILFLAIMINSLK